MRILEASFTYSIENSIPSSFERNMQFDSCSTYLTIKPSVMCASARVYSKYIIIELRQIRNKYHAYNFKPIKIFATAK